MRTLFDQLVAEGEPGIDRIISERTLETVQLDFKIKKNSAHGRFDDDDKKVYGKALSAFANSSGGLLIWGIDARKGPDGVDCAQSPGVPINDIEQFQVEATRFAGDLLVPRHDGIVLASVPAASIPKAGYLLVHVERSERRPHRCEAKGDKHYYKRAGDSSFMMEHYDVEDAFKRFTSPKLTVGARCSPVISDGAGRILRGRLEIYLANVSTVTAKMPYLQVRRAFGAGASGNPPPHIIRQSEGEWYSHSGDASVVIHPGLTRSMVAYDVNYDWSPDMKIEGKHPYLWGFALECRFGCENVEATEATIELEHGDLMRSMQF